MLWQNTTLSNRGTITLSDSYKNYRFLVFELSALLGPQYIGSSCIISSYMLSAGNNMTRVWFTTASYGYIEFTDIKDNSLTYKYGIVFDAGWNEYLHRVYGVK